MEHPVHIIHWGPHTQTPMKHPGDIIHWGPHIHTPMEYPVHIIHWGPPTHTPMKHPGHIIHWGPHTHTKHPGHIVHWGPHPTTHQRTPMEFFSSWKAIYDFLVSWSRLNFHRCCAQCKSMIYTDTWKWALSAKASMAPTPQSPQFSGRCCHQVNFPELESWADPDHEASVIQLHSCNDTVLTCKPDQ